VVFRAVEGDQQAAAKPAEQIQTAGRALQPVDIFRERRMQQSRIGGVEHGADVVVAGDLGDAEQACTVGPAVPGLELTLVRQERRALHEEDRQGHHADVAHAVGRVGPPPLVRGPVQAAAQRSQQRIEQRHDRQESHFGTFANPLLAASHSSADSCCLRDSPLIAQPHLNRIENRCRGCVIERAG